MAGEDSPLLQPEASAGPRRVCKFAVLTALALGAVGAVASSRVQGRHVVEGPPAALFEDFAPPSDSSDVFGCGCTIGWCCKNKDPSSREPQRGDSRPRIFAPAIHRAHGVVPKNVDDSSSCLVANAWSKRSAGRDAVASTRVRRFQTVIGNAGWHFDPRLSKDTICTLDASKRPDSSDGSRRRRDRDASPATRRLLAGAEVDAGKRDGSLSVCDPAGR